MGHENIKCGDKVNRFGRVFEQVYTVRFIYGELGIVRSYELSNGNFYGRDEIVKV